MIQKSGGMDMKQLLKLLSSNARTSVQELAAMLNKSPQEVEQMIHTCEKEGYIKGYHTMIDWEKTDANQVQAIIELCVRPKRDCGFDEIAKEIAAFEEVDSVILMSGGYDLSVKIIGKSFQEIALFVARRLSTLEGVLSTKTHFVLQTYKKEGVIYEEEMKDEREQQI